MGQVMELLKSGPWDPDRDVTALWMALQPATGARDLNPQQVEHNHWLRERLASVYRLWGYEEVSPPRVERIDTLKAGGGIASQEIVRLVADEPLGLRPEMTASIARAASTRLSQRTRPLRLWASGTVFESRQADEGRQCIEEKLHSGVELFGAPSPHGELELLSLLMAATESLGLKPRHQARLLVGHAALMDLILSPFKGEKRNQVKTALTELDRLELDRLGLEPQAHERLLRQLDLRGEPSMVLEEERRCFGPQPVLNDLERMFKHLSPLAQRGGIDLQLDPSFQPHYGLYDGLVFQLVCQGHSAPVVIARGGRYDTLVARFDSARKKASGLGFSFCLDDVRDLPDAAQAARQSLTQVLIAYSDTTSLEDALEVQRGLHREGITAEVMLGPLVSREAAEQVCQERCCSELRWLTH